MHYLSEFSVADKQTALSPPNAPRTCDGRRGYSCDTNRHTIRTLRVSMFDHICLFAGGNLSWKVPSRPEEGRDDTFHWTWRPNLGDASLIRKSRESSGHRMCIKTRDAGDGNVSSLSNIPRVYGHTPAQAASLHVLCRVRAQHGRPLHRLRVQQGREQCSSSEHAALQALAQPG